MGIPKYLPHYTYLEGCTQCRVVLPVDWKIAEDTVVQPDNQEIVPVHRNCVTPAFL
jgi:hypothetical protein